MTGKKYVKCNENRSGADACFRLFQIPKRETKVLKLPNY
ncbi:hypothetical protein AB434_0562 [Heyndrickxia coagulans]|nr:hypothetical protein AB434_0562 [Heyndrickxia coagulans]